MQLNRKHNHLHDEYAVSLDLSIRKGKSLIPLGLYPVVKRASDILMALFGLILASPILLLTVFLIKIETPGPAFFLQERVGINGGYFNVIKLRSMGVHAEKNGAQWAVKNDPRVTKVGAFIRKTRIDEIPQLINVLRGEMSMVGPRPERPIFTAQFNDEIPGFVQRLSVKPGITGWAQVNGGYDITPEQKLELDLYYIRKQSLRTDILVLLKTVKVVLTGDGAR
ncbi:sugar transferase [bacterium LRH843]|nr:sugar transferase [bacterium LRH843]